MMEHPTCSEGRRPLSVRGAVYWYGLYQLVHVFVNVRGLWLLFRGGIDFPAPPPPGGWTVQVLHFFTGMAALDLVNALLALVFVYGYYRRARWYPWLGTLTLTISLYAALVFNYATWASGAWTGPNLPAYLFVNVTFLPVVYLFAWVCIRGARRALVTLPPFPHTIPHPP